MRRKYSLLVCISSWYPY